VKKSPSFKGKKNRQKRGGRVFKNTKITFRRSRMMRKRGKRQNVVEGVGVTGEQVKTAGREGVHVEGGGASFQRGSGLNVKGRGRSCMAVREGKNNQKKGTKQQSQDTKETECSKKKKRKKDSSIRGRKKGARREQYLPPNS